MSIRTTYDSDSDNLFDITWHKPTSARDALTQCSTNASIAALLCIIYLASCVMLCWEYRPECKTENEISAKQHLEQCKREEKPRLRAEIKLAPLPQPLKRSQILILTLPGPMEFSFREEQGSDGQLHSLFFKLLLEIREPVYEYGFLAGNPGLTIHLAVRQKKLGHLRGME